MENTKQRGSSSSSFTEDLFGPKDSSKSPSSGLFGSFFGSPNLPKKSSRVMKKQNDTSYMNGTIEPSYYNSSIYYGGQDAYSPTTHNTSSPRYVPSSRHTYGTYQFKNDGAGKDQNENDSNNASRGNWWQVFGKKMTYASKQVDTPSILQVKTPKKLQGSLYY